MATMIAGFVFLLGRWSRVVFIMLVIYLAIVAAVEGFLKINFFDCGLHGEAMMVVLVNASYSEICEFLRTYLTGKTLLFGVVGLLILVLITIVVSFVPIRKPSIKTFLVFAILEGSMLGCRMVGRGCSDQVLPALLEHEFLHQELNVYRDLKEAGQLANSDEWRINATNRLVVVAIGESSTRAHWSMYGYPRATTPHLQSIARELICFSNCLATAHLTPFALRDSLTSVVKSGRSSIPAIAAAVGYDSVLLSAQGHWSDIDGADELLFKACRDRVYACEHVKPPFYDADLIPFLASEMRRKTPIQTVFLHFYGSHIEYSHRYPTSFARISDDLNDEVVGKLAPSRRARVNNYDNSIAYTDEVLCECISMLKAEHREVVFVYFSDHGETPLVSNRDVRNHELFEIPFFIWASPEMRAADPALFARLSARTSQRITSVEFFSIFLELLGISPR